MPDRTGTGTTTAGQGAGTLAVAVPEGTPALPPRISWGAVFAGGVVAVAVGAMLNVLGLAIGGSTVDATTPGETPSASSFGIAAGLWPPVANLVGLGAGGYVAARLSGTSDDTDGILHGLSAWAVGYLIPAVLLGNVIAGTASTAFQGVSAMVGGAARGAGGDPAQMTSEQRNAEIARIPTRGAAPRSGTAGSR
ncbi:hypothetical protein [Caldovatus aquaticus]|uniref:PhnA-like protein n=1 Tax=Caldovatus aquaticus TaxID=2865671 RepID=A0ABS7F3H5_9PROT|nr:hypothetical protein [Caldovatus aquaticus]MBW8269350.1 hypothetical protein [Caldovatus aquaticus]